MWQRTIGKGETEAAPAAGSSSRARDMRPDKADKEAFSADTALPLLQRLINIGI